MSATSWQSHAMQRLPISKVDPRLDQWYNNTSAQVRTLSRKNKRQFRKKLRLAKLFISEPIQVRDLTHTLRVALVQFHNRLIGHTELQRTEVDYLNTQQTALRNLAERLATGDILEEEEVHFLDQLKQSKGWLEELLDLVEELRA